MGGCQPNRDTLAAMWDRKDKIPIVTRRGGEVYNYWVDAEHKRALKGRGLAGIRARASLIEAEAGWARREGGGTVFTLRKHAAARGDAPEHIAQPA